MLNQLNRQAGAMAAAAQTPDVSGVVNMYRTYQMAKNPMAALQQMASRNPMLAQLQQMRGCGTDMRKTFFQLCQQQGVDPQSILSQFE